MYLEGEFPSEFQRLQIETRQYLEELKAENSNIKIRFVNPEGRQDQLVRSGMYPSQLTVEENLKIIAWKTRYGQENVKKGETVGYNRAFKAFKNTTPLP